MLFGIAFSLIGFMLAFVPFKTDSQFRSALSKGDLNGLMKTTNQAAITSQHLGTIIGLAINNNYPDQARSATKILNEKFPKDFYGWKALYYQLSSSPEEKKFALENMRVLDPYNPDIPK
jgi:hypothetical protein